MIPLYEPYLLASYKEAVISQVISGWIGPGLKVGEFEQLLSAQFDRDVTVVGSGTQALMLAYLALDLPDGVAIACPAYGFPACQNAAKLLGYEVELIDVKPETGCMDVDALSRRIYSNRRLCHCVVFVDHNGYTGDDLARVAEICREAKIPLIEDASVALGCERAGQYGTLSTLSFSVPKVVTTGQGGAVMTADPVLAAHLKQLADQGGGDWRKTRLHKAVGGNFRMTDMQAALGAAQMRDLKNILERRAEMWSWYRERITPAYDVRLSGWMMTVRARDASHADLMMQQVRTDGFDCKRLYHPVQRCGPYEAADALYPGAVEVYDRVVYLPSSLNLTRAQVNKICDAVERAS